MRIQKFWQTGVLILGLVLTTATTVNGDVLYDSNGFEPPTFTLGTISGQNGFSTPASISSQIVIQDTVFRSGTQALALSPFREDGTQRAIARRSVAFDDTEFFLAFSAMPPAQDTVSSNAVVNVRNGAGGIYLSITFVNASGRINGIAGADFLRDQWNDIVVRIELPSDGNDQVGNYDLWLNDELIGTGFALTNNTNAGQRQESKTFDFDWTILSDTSGSFYVDNFVVRQIPEPAGMTLLVVGGTLMLLGRR